MATLNTSALAQFSDQGFLPAAPCISLEQAQLIRDKLESYESELGHTVTGINRFRPHLILKCLSDLIRDPGLLDRVESLIGPDIMVWSTDWWIKEANSTAFVSWHQDSQYWGLDTTRLVTAWIAISPATVESGCMRVLPGSHQGPDLPHEDTFHTDNMLTRGQSITSVDETAAVNLEVNTGEVAMFAFRLAHASNPNRSNDRRIGFAIRYLPPDSRQIHSNEDSAALVRGEDNFGYFQHEPEPKEDFDPVALAFREEADQIRRSILYQGTGRQAHRT